MNMRKIEPSNIPIQIVEHLRTGWTYARLLGSATTRGGPPFKDRNGLVGILISCTSNTVVDRFWRLLAGTKRNTEDTASRYSGTTSGRILNSMELPATSALCLNKRNLPMKSWRSTFSHLQALTWRHKSSTKLSSKQNRFKTIFLQVLKAILLLKTMKMPEKRSKKLMFNSKWRKRRWTGGRFKAKPKPKRKFHTNMSKGNFQLRKDVVNENFNCSKVWSMLVSRTKARKRSSRRRRSCCSR